MDLKKEVPNKVHDALSAMRGIADLLSRMPGVAMKADKPGTRKGKKKTKKGAVHKHGSVFLGRKILSTTHAKYRRAHKGIVTRTPNYKLQHPAPRALNVKPVSSQIMNLLRGGKDGSK